VVVLDDYHLIENGEIHGAIELLVERLPSTAQLVISTRSDPPLPLSRLRARGQLIELRGGDLRFNVTEAGAFLNDVVGLDLQRDEIARLHERTEGWAAGLHSPGCRSVAARTTSGSSTPSPGTTNISSSTSDSRYSTTNPQNSANS
jgi:LuxR family transcriptional regulator, maltose regulon positive regulatory protein